MIKFTMVKFARRYVVHQYPCKWCTGRLYPILYHRFVERKLLTNKTRNLQHVKTPPLSIVPDLKRSFRRSSSY